MMCSTLRMSTAYWMTERQLRSVWTTRFATFRCTKSSPGGSPTISLAGTRLSEQPIQRYLGDCCSESLRKKAASCRVIRFDQARLFSKRWVNFTGLALMRGHYNVYPNADFVQVTQEI